MFSDESIFTLMREVSNKVRVVGFKAGSTRWRSGWSVRFAVGRAGVHSPCRVIPKDFKKVVFTASLLGAWHLWKVVDNKPTSSLVVSLGKALNGTPPPLCGRQVAQVSIRKEGSWQKGYPTVKQMPCNKNAKISAVATPNWE